MEGITYSLIQDGEESSAKYYEDISIASKYIIEKINLENNNYLDEFITYIQINNKEEVRSKEEYGIELLLIGVLFIEYLDNARAFKIVPKLPFKYLNNLRNKHVYKTKKIDYFRGILNNKFLLRKKTAPSLLNINEFINLREWLKATNDFNEEIIRIENWIEYLSTKEKEYVNNFLNLSMSLGGFLYNIGEEYLTKYTGNVCYFLENKKCEKVKREDIIYCTKGKIQYYFNMIASEVMNNVYRESFFNCYEKVIFLPMCMKQTKKECNSIITSGGFKCKGCSQKCNINKVNKIVNNNDFNVYIIPHESYLFKLINYNKKKGMIGVACVLNLMSGGWKALRIGYIPQCIPLDYCGCNTHWMESPLMTDINWDRLDYYNKEYK